MGVGYSFKRRTWSLFEERTEDGGIGMKEYGVMGGNF